VEPGGSLGMVTLGCPVETMTVAGTSRCPLGPKPGRQREPRDSLKV